MFIAVVAALAAGWMFAVGSVLQQDAARQAPVETALSWRLIADLAHRKLWLLGIGGDVASFGLQALALAYGPLALVQPLLVTGILFSIPLSVRWRGMRLGPREWTGTVLVGAGLATFLAAASPSEGLPRTSLTKWVLILIAVGGLMALAVTVGKAARGQFRASCYGVAAGAAFGLMAALTKTCTWLLGRGFETFFTSWQPYGLAVVAIAGAIVQQSAFQAGPLAASVPVMDALEPTVAVLIGVFAFHEQLGRSAPAVACQGLGIAALLAGIVLLDRSPVVEALQAGLDSDRAGEAAAAGRPGHLAPKPPVADRNVAETVTEGGAPVTDGAQ